jgi:hypothetical protein
MTWFLNFNLGRPIYFLLLVARDSNRELQAQDVRIQSRGDFTIVFWPVRQGSLSPLRGSLRTSTVWHSTWWSRLWTLWRMSRLTGQLMEGDGIQQMQSTLNFLAHQNGQKDRVKPV